MKRINVIKKFEPDDTRTLTQVEREIKYEQLSQKLPEIEKYHFDNLRDIEFYETTLPSKNIPEITGIIIKELLEISKPIIDLDKKPTSIILQLNKPIAVYDENEKLNRTISSKTNFYVSGLIIDNHIKIPKHNLLNKIDDILFSGNWNKIADQYLINDLFINGPKEFLKFDFPEQLIIKKTEKYKFKRDKLSKYSISGSNETNIDRSWSSIKKFSLYGDTKLGGEEKTHKNESSSGLITNINIEYVRGLYLRLKILHDLSNMSLTISLNKIKNRLGNKKLFLESKIPLATIGNLDKDMKIMSNFIIETLDNPTKTSFVLLLHSIRKETLYYKLIYEPKIGMQLLADNKIKNDLSRENRLLQIKQNVIKLIMYQKNAMSREKFGKNFVELAKSQREIINNIIQHREKMFKQTTFSQELIAGIHSLDVEERIKSFRAMQKINGDIKLEDVICRHVIYNIQQEIKKINESIIREETIKQFSGSSDKDFYSCKYCGEILATVEFESMSFGEGTSAETFLPVEKMIYSIIINIVSNYIAFKFITVVQITRSVFKVIRDFILELDVKLHKIRSNSEEIINDTLKVYIFVYTYAFLINSMFDNKYISFKVKIGTQKDIKKGAFEIFNRGLYNPIVFGGAKERAQFDDHPQSNEIFTKIYNPSIDYELPNDYNERSMELFTIVEDINDSDALEKIENQNSDNNQQIIYTYLDNELPDETYSHFLQIKNGESFNYDIPRNIHFGGDDTSSEDSFDARREEINKEYKTTPETIGGCGCTIGGCDCIFSGKPELKNAFVGGCGCIYGGSADNTLFTIALNLINKDCGFLLNKLGITLEYIKQSLVKAYNDIGKQKLDLIQIEYDNTILNNPFYLFLAKKINRDPIKVNSVIGADPDQMNIDELLFDRVAETKDEEFNELIKFNKIAPRVPAIPITDEIKSIYEKFEEFDKKNYDRKLQTKIKTMTAMISTKEENFRKFSPREEDLSLILGPDGKIIKWDIILTNLGEFTTKEIENLIGKKEYYSLKVLDYKSSKFGILKSKLTTKQIKTSLIKKVEINSFYNYYTFKCPVSTIHEWVSLNKYNGSVLLTKCNKCNITSELINNEDENFYNKWVNNYIKDKNSEKIEGTVKTKYFNPIKEVPDIKLQTELINKIVNITGLDYNILINLGFTENFLIEDIKEKNANPYESETVKINRCLRIIDHYNFALRANYQIATNKTRKLEPNLQDIINKTKQDLANIPKMPKLEYNIYSMNICNFSNLLINTFYKELENLTQSKEYKTIMTDFVIYIVKKVVETDRLVSKFTLSKLKERTDQAETQEGNSLDAMEQIGNISDDEEFGDNEFSFDGMDFEDFDNIESNDFAGQD